MSAKDPNNMSLSALLNKFVENCCS